MPPPNVSPRLRWACLLLVCWLIGSVTTHAQQQTQKVEAVTVTLVADTTAIAPGKPFTAGVHFEIDPDWNIYWQFGGDALPSVVEWDLPPGFTAGPLQWSLPTTHRDAVTGFTYALFHNAFAYAEITPPAKLSSDSIALKAKVSWLMCGPGQCKPRCAELTSPLTVGEPAPINAAMFSRWRADSPRKTAPPFTVKWDRRSPTKVALLVEGLPKEFKVEFFPLPPEGVTPGEPLEGGRMADGTRVITIPFTKGGAPNLAWRGVIATRNGDGSREGWIIESAGAPTFASGSVASAALTTRDLFALLWSAFLGGVILNLMPCVLPVIALKIFGLVRQAGAEPRRVFRLGLAFVAGVFTFFLGLAALTVGLKSFGIELNWGFQFQSPIILAGLIVLVFVFALNLLGAFEVVLAGGTASRLSELAAREGYGGAFLHGLFTTLLGTSCTAPFLGAALGLAFVAPAPIVFAIFLSIAAGMSLPYFLLTAKPAWLRFVPKPGAWMERLKQLTGFIMLGVVLWLLGVYGGTSEEVARLTALGGFLLIVAVACWIHGLQGRRIVSWAAIAILLGSGYFLFLRPSSGEHIAWEPWSEQRVAEAVASGQPVFVDFTASWCANCKLNERLAIETADLRAALAQKNVLTLKADWSTRDPVIRAGLQKYGQDSVPNYLLCPGGDAPCTLLPSILTKSLLLTELGRLPEASEPVSHE